MKTERIDAEVTVTLIIMPKNRSKDMKLPAAATVQLVIDGLISEPSLNIERIDPITLKEIIYTLTSKGMGKELAGHKTLYEAGVRNGDTLVLNPELIAGYF